MYDKCLEINPKEDQCLFNYANLMEQQNNDQKAKKLYLKCLLINDKMACVHHRLGKLLMKSNNSMSNHNIKQLLQKACQLKPSNHRYQQELNTYLQTVRSSNETHSVFPTENQGAEYKDNDIKLVIYDFDSIICYANFSEFFHGSMQVLIDTRTKQLKCIFGGFDRINKMKSHFEVILSKKSMIAVLSITESDIISHALKRLKLDRYFDFIVQTNSKIDDIIKLKRNNRIFRKEQVLFIDNDINQINKVSDECITYFVDESKSEPFRGLTPEDFTKIECIIHNRKYSPPNILKYNPKKSLNSINNELCTAIFREIGHNWREREQPIESLPCMKYASEQSVINKDYHRFTEFGKKLAIVFAAGDKEEQWTCGHLLKYLLRFEQGHVELWKRYAKSLSCLGHDKAAEEAYSKGFKVGPNAWRLWMDYAYHHLSREQYHDAVDAFRKTLKLCRDGNRKWNVNVGLARALDALDKNKEAEYYYKQGMSCSTVPGHKRFYESGHLHFGNFLMKLQRFAEAKEQYHLCLQHNPTKALNNYRYGNALYELGDYEQFEYYMNRTLEIEPYHPLANRSLQYYLNQKSHDPESLRNKKKQAKRSKNVPDAEVKQVIIDEMENIIDDTLENESKSTTHQTYAEKAKSNKKAVTKTAKAAIKLVIYEFESVITYWNLAGTINDNMQLLYDMRKLDLVNIFGGFDRIEAFKQHFESIRHRDDIRIIILSYTASDIITEALQRVKLLEYFDLIIGGDTSPFLLKTNSKLHDIKALKKQNKLSMKDEILYINPYESEIAEISNECKTYFIDHSKCEPLHGPTPDQLHHIECIVHRKPYKPTKFEYDENKCLCEINEQLYNGMVREIFDANDNDRSPNPTHSVSSMEHAKKRTLNNPDYQRFITFGQKFAIVVKKQRQEKWWISANILKELFEFERKQPGLYRLYGKCLSYLRHSEAAGHAYNQAINIAPNVYKSWLSYAFHLLHHKEYEAAKKAFYRALKIREQGKQHKFHPITFTLCIGMARTLQELNEADEAEKYFKEATERNINHRNKQFYEVL